MCLQMKQIERVPIPIDGIVTLQYTVSVAPDDVIFRVSQVRQTQTPNQPAKAICFWTYRYGLNPMTCFCQCGCCLLIILVVIHFGLGRLVGQSPKAFTHSLTGTLVQLHCLFAPVGVPRRKDWRDEGSCSADTDAGKCLKKCNLHLNAVYNV